VIGLQFTINIVYLIVSGQFWNTFLFNKLLPLLYLILLLI